MAAQMKQGQEAALEEINQEWIRCGHFDHVEDLEEKLEVFKRQFCRFDEDLSGDIDLMELKKMMETMGQAKTHLQLKRMIQQVDTTKSGTITYREFLQMMLGKENSVLKMILMFEALKEKNDEDLPPKPKRVIVVDEPSSSSS